MQQGQGLARQETVVNEEGLFDRQARVAALQFAGAIVLNAVREDQILGASGRPHRVSLDKTQTRNGPRQAGSFEKAARDRVAADRKSTRLNSSHRCISYAVFCLKKKNKKEE